MAERVWTYQVYDQDTPPELFDAFSPMVALWRSRFSGDQVPSWKDFELEDFAGWYGQLSLGQIASDFSEFTFLLWGTKLTDWWGKDYTGKAMSHDSREMRENWEQYERPYAVLLLEARGIGFCQGSLAFSKREFIQITYLDFPLLYEGNVSRVLSVYALGTPLGGLPSVTPLHDVVEPYQE